MRKVKCISIRPLMPKQVEVGNIYYMDETTRWSDNEGDMYATIYADESKKHKIGNLLLSHFRIVEDKSIA